MKFRPLHDRVVVERIDAEAKSAGGIIIPDSAQEKPSQGEIVAVGRPLGRERDTVSWRNFGHASRTASDRQATVTRRSLKRLTGRGREMSDIVDGLETWEWPR